MSEFGDRARSVREGFSLGAERTQLAIASVAAVLILIVAAIALPGGGKETSDLADDRSSDATSDPSLVLGEDSTPGDAGTSSGNGASRGSGTVTAPGGGPDPTLADIPKDVAFTATAMKVGIAYLKDPGTANAAAGFAGIGQLDQKRAWDAMIKVYNQNPPYGRKIVPVYYSTTTDDLTSKGAERIEQEACAHYTKDNKVFMVWGGIVGLDTLRTCLAKANVPLIGGGGSRADYAKFPLMIAPNSSAMERMAEFEVDNLVSKGFFKSFKDNPLPYTPQKPADGKARIGLIRYDEPAFKAGAAAMKARLAKHGLSLCSGCEFEVSYSSDNIQEQLDDATEVNAAIQNCKSRPDGPCTHMLFLGTTAGVRLTLFFVDGAEKQQYRPRLGFNPQDAPYAVADALGQASYPQFRQSVIVSDTPAAFKTRTDAHKACKKIVQDAGESFEGSEASNKENQLPVHCDPPWYTQAVLLKAGPELTVDSFMRSVDSVSPVPSADVYLMQTKQGRHDGSGAIRVGQWYDDCNCWKPTTAIIPV